jgi:hypothetical protein
LGSVKTIDQITDPVDYIGTRRYKRYYVLRTVLCAALPRRREFGALVSWCVRSESWLRAPLQQAARKQNHQLKLSALTAGPQCTAALCSSRKAAGGIARPAVSQIRKHECFGAQCRRETAAVLRDRRYCDWRYSEASLYQNTAPFERTARAVALWERAPDIW